MLRKATTNGPRVPEWATKGHVYAGRSYGPIDQARWMTTVEAMRELGWKERNLRLRLAQGVLKCKKHGRYRLVSRDSVAKLKGTPTPTTPRKAA